MLNFAIWSALKPSDTALSISVSSRVRPWYLVTFLRARLWYSVMCFRKYQAMRDSVTSQRRLHVRNLSWPTVRLEKRRASVLCTPPVTRKDAMYRAFATFGRSFICNFACLWTMLWDHADSFKSEFLLVTDSHGRRSNRYLSEIFWYVEIVRCPVLANFRLFARCKKIRSLRTLRRALYFKVFHCVVNSAWEMRIPCAPFPSFFLSYSAIY